MKRRYCILLICAIAFLQGYALNTDFDVDSLLSRVNVYVEKNKYDEALSLLKDAFITSSYSKKNKELRKIAETLDDFLTHTTIKPGEIRHNEVLSFICYYDSIPFEATLYLNDSVSLAVNNEKIYMGEYKNDTEEIHMGLMSTQLSVNPKNKHANKTLNKLIERHSKHFATKDFLQKSVLFYVKDENLYYAAIPSKEIPDFEITSDNDVINWASCIKVILQASGLDSDYEDIIHNFMHTSIDEAFLSFSNCGDSISGKKVTLNNISLEKLNAQIIVENLCYHRFLIAVDKKGKPSLITAIALDENHNPVHIRIRTPRFIKEEQRIQMSWQKFTQDMSMLFDLRVYN
ncbi:MAG: hypothetical protein IAA73_01290 [Bacteroidetes bacterium]|uniref:Uncharacterized protein n=1 Tax=Candidatus Gallipaludibacter merdavium TaxID=2840839 RepID=A0A9D9N3L2_9BACT|nr:hypothetical protein [Candidatus Gallipaludibacter merdavium]